MMPAAMDRRTLVYFFPLLCTLLMLPLGCAQLTSSLKNQYGADADYFAALEYIKNNEKFIAFRMLKNAAKNASPLVARRSQETLAMHETAQERLVLYREIHKTYGDEPALLQFCRELDSQHEYAAIISATNGLDLSTCDNELAFFRCNALLQKRDSRFDSDCFTWFTVRPFTSLHHSLCSKIDKPNQVIAFRDAVFMRRYSEAFAAAKKLSADDAKLPAQLVSDFGKASLYGSSLFLQNAAFFESLSSRVADDSVFYAHFYAGRLYDSAEGHAARALEQLKKAMDVAASSALFDNAFWYYLNTELKHSVTAVIESLEKFRGDLHDPFYFDDFFDALSVRLLSQHKWYDYYRVAQILDGFASDETVAKFSYVAARLIQTGRISNSELIAPGAAEALLNRALHSGADFYYRMQSASALGLADDELFSCISQFGQHREIVPDKNAERLLQGYVDFGLPEYLYQEWLRVQNKVSMDCVQKIAHFLKQCGTDNPLFYVQSLRIASRAANNPERALSKELLELVFPRDFSDAVHDACSRFGQEEYLLYGLIRSESFFDEQVVSHAGAIGLTQLMSGTASDVARKLKYSEYDLKDGATNILFGSYYLEELRQRLDGSAILALFAYNGGITRVRSWLKNVRLEFGESGLENDLFLESLPFSETREYGRKVISAAALYGFLYYHQNPSDVIENLMR